jgi:hypothetical protein
MTVVAAHSAPPLPLRERIVRPARLAERFGELGEGEGCRDRALRHADAWLLEPRAKP